MKIKMITLAAGPNGVKHPDCEYDVPDSEGKALVGGGFAVSIESASAPAVEHSEPLTIEQFAELGAADQKKLLAALEIEGDAGNEEKRVALYSAYLASKTALAGE